MLDTNICSYIMRKHPIEVLDRLHSLAGKKHRIVISAITYSELRYGAIGKKASPKHNHIVDEFMQRVDSVIPWDKVSVEHSSDIKKHLSDRGTPISNNDIAIAGNAIANDCILVTNNSSEFSRIPELKLENWVNHN